MSDEEKVEGQEEEKGGKKKNRALVIVSILSGVTIVVLAGALVMSYLRQNTVEEPETRSVVVHEENVESIAESMLRGGPTGIPMNYDVTMNSTWIFPDGWSASTNAYVENSVSNETPVYFDVVRNDTQETIYQSPVIPLGEYLDHIKLDEHLDAGDYECTLTYHLIDEKQNTLTTVNMWLMIRIES